MISLFVPEGHNVYGMTGLLKFLKLRERNVLIDQKENIALLRSRDLFERCDL